MSLSIIGNIVIFLTLLLTSLASAQGIGASWTQPYRLSSESGEVVDQVMFSDPFGYVHLFWPEIGLLENQSILYYSRFDGQTWTLPVDIIIAPPALNMSATVDIEGNLHLVYANGGSGAVFYTTAKLQDATSAHGWQKPQKLDINALLVAFKVDSIGIFHLLYSGFQQNERGIHYINSVDEGQTWSKSVWLDPDIPPDLAPSQILLDLGEENSLHAAWLYWDQDYLGRWIRYANSFDQGHSWSAPFTIDEVEAGSEDLRLPWPSMAVNGKDVHVIWAGDQQTHRKHRVSRDSGRTWNQAVFVFGDLHGGALGHGLGLDALGRLHFFGQIRWPQGIYQAYWEQGRWSSPFMIYLIAQGDSDPINERIHAHRVRVAIRAGNQLVVTFTTSPSDPQSILYEMHMTMPDVPASSILSLPEQTPVSSLDSAGLDSLTPLPETPQKMPFLDATLEPGPSRVNTPSSAIMWGIVPVVLLIAGVITIRFLFWRKD